MKPLSLVAGLLFSAALGFGQTALATVTGTITDASGAAIASAPIEIRNLANGAVFRAGSSDTGNFTVSQLPVGDYTLTVTVAGFKTFTHTNFHLAAAQTMREDVSLEVGQASESVTVTAEASLLKSESSELVHNVTLSQLNNLPVLPVAATNEGIRDPLAALRLAPGIRYSNASTAVTSIVVNGTPNNSLQTRLDGATMNPTSSRLLGATMETQPSVDAIEEVAVLTSNFAAEYGTAGGAMVNMVSKSGTNQLHGSVYDYAVNEVLNAHQPYTGLRNKVRQNDYGFTAGGPVWIPKLYNGKDKTFFFFSFEQYREGKIINTGTTTVPIAAYRNGDFNNLITQENRLISTAGGAYVDPLGRTTPSGTIFDPSTQRTVGGSLVRDAFPNNTIPATRFDPIAVKILALIPQPVGPFATSQAGSNYLAPYDQSRVSNIPSIKVDQVLGPKTRMSVYLQRTNTSTPRTATAADNFPDNITGSAISANSGRTVRVNFDYTASALLLLHLGLAWNDSDFLLQSQNYPFDAAKTLGLRGQTAARTFPIINTAVPTVNTGLAALGGMSNLGGSFDQHFFERRPLINFSGTYVRGSHTYKAGFEFRQEKFPNYDYSYSAGAYGFGPGYTQQTSLQGVTLSSGFTGFGFASFLLGGLNPFVSGTTTTAAVQLRAPIAAMTYKSQTALYLQDTWKVTRKLTLDYGLRWDYGTYTREQHGRYSSFSPTVPNPSASGRLGGGIFESTCNCNFASNYPYAIGPRLGAAYQIDRKTVFRAGFGVVYNATSVQGGNSVNSATSGTPAFGEVVGLLQDGVPSNVNAVWPNLTANAGQGVGTVSTAPPTLLDRNAGRPARLLQWNITLQREINRNLSVELGYVGNRGVWWETTTTTPLTGANALSEDTLRAYGFKDFTSASESALLTTTIAALTPTQRTTLASRGILGLPYANFPSNQTVRQSLMPYPQYNNLIAPAGAPLGKTWYDSFQLTIIKRFSRGLSFNVNYNYSKSLDLMSAPDIFNRASGKNLSTFDIPNQLRITAQYEVPRIHSDLPVLSNKIVSYALSGWGIGTFLNYQSAPLVGRPSSSGSVPISNFLGRGTTLGAQLKKDANGNYMNPWSIDWYDYDGTHHTDPLDINCHCFDPTKTQVLNPAAWENVPNGQWGDQSSIRWFRSFRVPSESANFSRNFRIKERVSLNVRVEFTNIFNRMQWPTSTTLPGGINLGNFANKPSTFSSGKNKGLYSGGFGTIVPTSGTSGQRAGTFVARLTF